MRESLSYCIVCLHLKDCFDAYFNKNFECVFGRVYVYLAIVQELIPIGIDLTTHHIIFWTTLESSLALASNTRILQIHMQHKSLKQGDLSCNVKLCFVYMD